jgi:hypothetical protein
MTKKHPNQLTIENFMAQFKMKRPICGTEGIDGNPVTNGFVAAHFDQGRDLGFSVFAYDPDKLHAFTEKVVAGKIERKDFIGTTAQAADFGKQIAEVIEPTLGAANV